MVYLLVTNFLCHLRQNYNTSYRVINFTAINHLLFHKIDKKEFVVSVLENFRFGFFVPKISAIHHNIALMKLYSQR